MTEKSILVESDQLPSFSIILETENLANADIKGLIKSLESLAKQDLDPSLANEVWLIESGDTPPELLAQLCQEYPWIKVCNVPLSTGYYKAKMEGARISTGEIIVYFDSDCIYESHWLRTILSTFNQGDQVNIVAGETMTRGLGIYGTAMAIAYIFPPYSGENNISASSHYFLNNVAFRREFLLNNPIPLDLPLYRGNCAIHAHQIKDLGVTIWKQPQARATHAPPSSLSHFFWRFLLIGHDYYWQNQLIVNQTDSLKGMNRKLAIFWQRLQNMLAYEPRHLIYFPFALIVALISSLLVAMGYLITSFKSDYLLKTYNQILGEV
jgi:glycosyltransferase involved in cell wall biosynthesis